MGSKDHRDRQIQANAEKTEQILISPLSWAALMHQNEKAKKAKKGKRKDVRAPHGTAL